MSSECVLCMNRIVLLSLTLFTQVKSITIFIKLFNNIKLFKQVQRKKLELEKCDSIVRQIWKKYKTINVPNFGRLKAFKASLWTRVWNRIRYIKIKCSWRCWFTSISIYFLTSSWFWYWGNTDSLKNKKNKHGYQIWSPICVKR